MTLPSKGVFVKKPIPINAEQWYPGEDVEEIRHTTMEIIGRIQTLAGPIFASPGDYIVTGVQGEKYPCKEDIFKKTYEVFDPEKHVQTSS